MLNFDISKITGFDWNQGNLEHIKKHNVNDGESEEVFLNNPLIVNEDETHSQKEERFRVYGKTNKNRLLTVIVTIRSDKLRVISARNQTKKEKDEFEKGGENI